MRILLFIAASIFFYSCASGQKESREENVETEIGDKEFTDYIGEMEQNLIGKWTNVAMRVRVNTYNKSDTSFIVDINEDNWDLKMTVKPIVTMIYDNGTYESEFRNSFDSLIYKPQGTWMIDGDSLIMKDHQAVYRYKIFIDGDMAEFKSLLDWDSDGQVDDEYFGVQRKTR
jgi:hypothetical protein